MTTDRQADANRNNSQRSTGPRTEAGRRVASQNALRHGGYAAATAISRGPWFESVDELERQIAGIVASLNPQCEAERCIAQMIAETFVRSDRITSFEAHVLASASADDGMEHAGLLTDTYRRLAHGARCVSQVVDHGSDWMPSDDDVVVLTEALLYVTAYVEDEPDNPKDPWAEYGHSGLRIRDSSIDRPTARELIWAVIRKQCGSLGSVAAHAAHEADKREEAYADLLATTRAKTATRCLQVMTSITMDASDRISRQLQRNISAYQQLRKLNSAVDIADSRNEPNSREE